MKCDIGKFCSFFYNFIACKKRSRENLAEKRQHIAPNYVLILVAIIVVPDKVCNIFFFQEEKNDQCILTIKVNGASSLEFDIAKI
jgi:hypothetical protein